MASENPKASAIYIKFEVFGNCDNVPLDVGGAAALATWVAEKAMNRNMKVPQNSPIMATSSFRSQFGIRDRKLVRVCPLAGVAALFLEKVGKMLLFSPAMVGNVTSKSGVGNRREVSEGEDERKFTWPNGELF